MHPHVHLIIPGGGIAPSGCWKHTKQKGRYLFPVKAMSTVFKHKYMEGFLSRFAGLKTENKTIEASVREMLYNKSWVVYAKQPFGGPEQVIEYLGRYTHKVAISNHRLLSIDDDKVSFTYKDYADASRQKTMTLQATEFLHRFCLHILPPGFRKIRYYGFMANTHSALLQVQQQEMGVVVQRGKGEVKKIAWQLIAKEKLNYNVGQRPVCKKGTMVTVLHFDANEPPDVASAKALLEMIKGKTA